ncbi:hypothetical protein [Streptomyces fulvoviolaceus]|uniref:hypothetical protein n=1 Tax=Streptomyces fulvoviolaceus TaxID=285535 RepID=UPI0004CBBF99|nr:hypothetical protein [Streptomyces fulvoviolaceus]
MDPITMAAGTALVSAMATDAWGQIRESVVALWRRGRPERAESVALELEELRNQVLEARSQRDAVTEDALAGAWRLRLQQLLHGDAELAEELRCLLSETLAPALDQDEQGRVQSIVQNATVFGGVSIQAGRDVHNTSPPRP